VVVASGVKEASVAAKQNHDIECSLIISLSAAMAVRSSISPMASAYAVAIIR
jgi:hypothetical protein